METAYFRCAGGSILLMDVPDAPAEDEPASDAYSRFMLQVGKGELVRLDEDTVEAVEVDGATQYRVKAVEEKAPRSRAKKADTEDAE